MRILRRNLTAGYSYPCMDGDHSKCPGSFLVAGNDSRQERCECPCHKEESPQAEYRLTTPKAMEGKDWWFYDHTRKGIQGLLLLGEVMWVETHYSGGEAYHSYHMRVKDYQRRRIVGEESLVYPAGRGRA